MTNFPRACEYGIKMSTSPPPSSLLEARRFEGNHCVTSRGPLARHPHHPPPRLHPAGTPSELLLPGHTAARSHPGDVPLGLG